MKQINCILLIDDNPSENSYNKILIEEMNIAEYIEIAESGFDALNYLTDKNNIFPDLIFLDLNMPKMNGWEFLKLYGDLPQQNKTNTIVVVLSNSSNPDDVNRALEIKEITNFELKPITKHALKEIVDRYF